jgi:hypothetical protein
MKLCHRLSLMVVMLSCSYFALMASRHIAIPGLYYDEVLFVNAATGGASDSFVARRIFGVPVMLMSYIGALKAYFYFPIFKLFGVSAATIRLPVICVSLVSLWMIFMISRLYFNAPTSAVVTSLVAFDPIFIFMTKLDFGPIVFMMLLKLLVLFFFIQTMTTASSRYLWPLVISAMLGLYDKLNFIWFILALGVSTAILFRAEISELFYSSRRRVSAIALPMACLTITILLGAISSLRLLMRTQGSDTSLWERIAYAQSLYAISMNGGELYSRVLDSQLASGTIVNYITVSALIMLVIGGVRILVQKRRGRAIQLSPLDRMMACYLILFALIFAQIVLTHKAGGAHHILMLYPLHHFIAVGAAVGVLGVINAPSAQRESVEVAGSVMPSRVTGESAQRPRHSYNFALGILLAVAGLLLASEVRVGLTYERAFHRRQTFNPRWSPVIYDLAAYVNDRDVDLIVFPDWGIHNQVFALGEAKTRAKCVDLWLAFRGMYDPRGGAEIFDKVFKGKRALAVLYPQDIEVMPKARENFFAFSDYFLGKRHLEKTFLTAQGEPIFEIYYIDRQESESAAIPH